MRTPCLLIPALAMLVSFVTAAVTAQEVATGTWNPEKLTVETITTHRQAVEAGPLKDEARASVLALYDQALLAAQESDRMAAQAAEHERRINSVDQNRRAVEQQLAMPIETSAPKNATGFDLSQLEQRLAEAERRREELRQEAAAYELEATRRVAARKELPDRIQQVRGQVQAIEAKLQTATPTGDPHDAAFAQYVADLARYQQLQQTLRLMETELAMIDATGDLLPLQRRLAAKRLEVIDQDVQQWRALVESQKKALASAEIAQARSEEAAADPRLGSLTEENRLLAEQNEELIHKTAALVDQLEKLEEDLNRIHQQRQTLEERADTVGLTTAIGALMRTRLASLPNIREHRRRIDARQGVSRDIQFKLFHLEDQRAQNASREARVDQIMRELQRTAVGSGRNELREQVAELVVRHDELLDKAIRLNDDYLKALTDVDVAERQLVDETRRMEAFIDQRVLWIASVPVMQIGDFAIASDAVTQGLVPEGGGSWGRLYRTIPDDARRWPLLWLAAALVFILWGRNLVRLRHRNTKWGEVAERGTCRDIAPTVYAVIWTIVESAFWPAICVFLASRLFALATAATDSGEAVIEQCAAMALMAAAGWLLLLGICRIACRPHGLLRSHFRWHPDAAGALRRPVRWLQILGVPLLMLVVFATGFGIDRWNQSIGRLGFILLMLLIATILHMGFRPKGRFFRFFSIENEDARMYRWRGFLHGLLVAAPLLLAGLAVFGYFYSAKYLAVRLGVTAYLLVGMFFVSAILSRWVLVTRRRRMVEQRMQQLRAAGEPTTEETSEIGVTLTSEEPGTDFGVLSAQTDRLIRSVLTLVTLVFVWMLWSEAIIALNILESIPVWERGTSVVGDEAAANGAAEATSFWGTLSIADVIWAVVTVTMTIVAAGNLPGLIEIAMPPQLAVDAGTRYAISMLTRYGIILTGIVVLSTCLGIGWSQVQWLVAAVGVGLGFGLQEIFANFVSGLIILFERPVRVGDVITIGDVSGLVSRIQIRATTVTNWDLKELIVPNKEFVTGRLLNWTRSDSLNRVVINVGVAYRSDPKEVTTLLREIVQEHPDVMEAPAPIITFEEFGDSALLFVVRCFLTRVEHRLRVRHELNSTIHARFAEAGIEIPFPQRDVNFRTAIPESSPSEEPGEVA